MQAVALLLPSHWTPSSLSPQMLQRQREDLPQRERRLKGRGLNKSYGASSSFYCEQPARWDMNTAQKLTSLVAVDSTNNCSSSVVAKLRA
eukprot:3661233-Rhodomonas_salina.3